MGASSLPGGPGGGAQPEVHSFLKLDVQPIRKTMAEAVLSMPGSIGQDAEHESAAAHLVML